MLKNKHAYTEQFSGETPGPNTGEVGLHNAVHVAYHLWWDPEPCTHPTHTAVGRRHKRVQACNKQGIREFHRVLV